MIRSTKHSLKFLNKEKYNKLKLFIDEYRKVFILMINDVFIHKSKLDYKNYKVFTWLSARILQQISKHTFDTYSGLDINISVLPDFSKINPSLNSKNYNLSYSSVHFDEFLSINCIGNKQKINIPIKYHKQFIKWSNKSDRITGIEVNENYIKINFEFVEPKTSGKSIIGIDQGINSVITTSDNQLINNTDIHGHTLNTILNKLSRKKSGSKASSRCLIHRNNFINWTINQLNLKNIKEIRLEKLSGLISHNKKLSRWNYGFIKRKIFSFAQEHGVRVLEQSSYYRSRRCSSCGLVRKSNRKGKEYNCDICGFKSDADLNAAKNHEIDLPKIDFRLGCKNDFYWLESGFYDINHQELIVPVAPKQT